MFNRFFRWNINRKQADLDKKQDLFGFSDEILEEQVKLNQEKFKRNIKEKDFLQ